VLLGRPPVTEVKLHMKNKKALIALLIPVISSILLVVMIGPDTNGDLYWYHYHNGWSWLHDRMFIDLAPAGFPSYYNPFMDTFLYEMYSHLHPIVLVGIIIGLIQGLAFYPIYFSIRQILPTNKADEKLIWLSAVTGLLGPAWSLEAGNSMGDATTVILTSTAVLFTLSSLTDIRQKNSTIMLVMAGLFAGIATGLKLTNAITGFALILALMLAMPWVNALIAVLKLMVGEILGYFVVSGLWLWKIWLSFGNPFFPQFSNVFHNPLAQNSAFNVARYTPQTLLDAIVWPFVFSLFPERAGGHGGPPILLIWFIFLPISFFVLTKALTKNNYSQFSIKQKFLIGFVFSGFFIWEYLFSVFRYLGQIEVFLPAVMLSLLLQFNAHHKVISFIKSIFKWSLILTFFSLLLKSESSRWTNTLFESPPALRNVSHSAVVLSYFQLSYVAPGMSLTNAYLQLEPGFPFSPKYDRLLSKKINQFKSQYILINANSDWRAVNIQKANVFLGGMHVLDTKLGCSALNVLLSHVHTHADLKEADSQHCKLIETSDDTNAYLRSAGTRYMAAITPVDNDLFTRTGYRINSPSCQLLQVMNGTYANNLYLCAIVTNYK